MIIVYIVTVFALLILITSFYNLRLSISLYVSYMILVPYMQFNISKISLSYNLINTIILLNFIYRYKVVNKTVFSFKTINPFIYLFICLLLLSLFSWSMPWSEQFNYWRSSFMKTVLIIFVFWNTALLDSKLITYVKWAVIISITIASIYGLFLTQMNGLNPYTSTLSRYFGILDSADVYTAVESRFNFSTAAKIQSTMVHPMTWSLVLSLLLVIFFALYIKESKKYLLLIILLGTNLLFSGVRTGIVAVFLGLGYYLIRNSKIKLVLYSLLFFAIGFYIINSNNDLSNIFSSFIDIKGSKSTVKGSSIQMRINQFNGALVEIKNVLLVGKGYGWNTYYQSHFGDHPVLLAFESLVFVVLCNSGLIGVFIWVLFFLLLFRLNRKILPVFSDVIIMDCFIIVYVSYAIGTGEYGYIQFFALFYTFFVAYLMQYFHLKKIKNNNVR